MIINYTQFITEKKKIFDKSLTDTENSKTYEEIKKEIIEEFKRMTHKEKILIVKEIRKMIKNGK